MATAAERPAALLSNDGTGRIAEIITQNCPVTILTHWQSLYSDGTCAGLWGLELLLGHLRKHYGDDLVWATCSEMAERTMEAVAN